jgi:hypothetical protein
MKIPFSAPHSLGRLVICCPVLRTGAPERSPPRAPGAGLDVSSYRQRSSAWSARAAWCVQNPRRKACPTAGVRIARMGRCVPLPCTSDECRGERSGPVLRITGYASQRGRRVLLLPPYYRRPPSSVSPVRWVRRASLRWARPESGVMRSEVLRPLIRMRSGAYVALRQDTDTDKGVRVGGIKAPVRYERSGRPEPDGRTRRF